jgi:hypothetical protein
LLNHGNGVRDIAEPALRRWTKRQESTRA